MMNSSRTASTTRACRLHPLNETLTALALLLLACVAPAGAYQAPDLEECPTLELSEGNQVAWHVYAEGVQIYRWNGTSWIFVAPEAVLFADAGGHGQVGFHYAGPTWETLSGSKVVGVVIDRCTPDPTAIPWLKLGVVSN